MKILLSLIGLAAVILFYVIRGTQVMGGGSSAAGNLNKKALKANTIFNVAIGLAAIIYLLYYVSTK